MSTINKVNSIDALTAIGAVPLTKVENKKPDSFFTNSKPTPIKSTKPTTVIVIVAFVLIILAIIFMRYIIINTDYSQMYTNLVIIVAAIIAVTIAPYHCAI